MRNGCGGGRCIGGRTLLLAELALFGTKLLAPTLPVDDREADCCGKNEFGAGGAEAIPLILLMVFGIVGGRGGGLALALALEEEKNGGRVAVG